MRTLTKHALQYDDSVNVKDNDNDRHTYRWHIPIVHSTRYVVPLILHNCSKIDCNTTVNFSKQ